MNDGDDSTVKPSETQSVSGMDDKTIIRVQHGKENPYFLMARRTAQDKTLTYDALGLLAYLLSKPDNWQISIEELKRTGSGRDHVRKMLQELLDKKYATHEDQQKDAESGQFTRLTWVIYETPFTENPYTGSGEVPFTEKPSTVNHPRHNRDIQNRKTTTKPRKARGGAASSHSKKPQYGFVVNWRLVEGAGGQIELPSGDFLSGIDRPAFAQTALRLFAAYLDVMRGFGKMPLGRDEELWEVHQEAALRLAVAGMTEEQVERYITFRYTDKEDRFWQTRPGYMKLEHLAKTLPTFEYPVEKKGASADYSRPASPVYPEHRAYSREELDALKAAVDAEMKLEAMMQEDGMDVRRWNELREMSEEDLQAVWEAFGFTGAPSRVRIMAEENRAKDPEWAKRLDTVFGFAPAAEGE